MPGTWKPVLRGEGEEHSLTQERGGVGLPEGRPVETGAGIGASGSRSPSPSRGMGTAWRAVGLAGARACLPQA